MSKCISYTFFAFFRSGFFVNSAFILLIIAALIFPVHGIVQENTIPEILRNIEKAPDSEIHILLNDLSEELRDSLPEQAYRYADSALKLSEALRDTAGIIRSIQNLGEISLQLYDYQASVRFFQKAREIKSFDENDSALAKNHFFAGISLMNAGEYENAFDEFSSAASIYQANDNIGALARTNFYIGSNSYNQSDFSSALKYFILAREYALNMEQLSFLIEIYNYMGVVYFDMGVYENALGNYMKSLEIAEELNDKMGIANALNNIGIVYYDWGKKEKALEYYQKSMRIEEKFGTPIGMAGSYNNIGIIYSDWDQNDLAIDYYQKALEIYQSHNDLTGIGDSKNNIGESYAATGKFDKALKNLFEALQIEFQLENGHGLAQSYHAIASVYFMNQEYDKAINYNAKSFHISDSLNLLQLKMTNEELFYKVYLEMSNYKNAFVHFKTYDSLKDSVYNQEFHRKIADLQLQHELEKDNKTKNQLQQNYTAKKRELKLQRKYLIIIFVLMIIFGILIFYDFKSKTKTNQKLREINDLLSEQKIKLSDTLESLSKSEAKYRSLVENAPTGIILLDKSGSILEVNRKMLHILGSPDEKETKKINCLNYPPLVEIGLAKNIRECFNSGKPFYDETPYKTKWDKQVYLKYYLTPLKNNSGDVIQLILNVEDVTSAMNTSLQKEETDVKYRILVENSLQAMLIVQDGRVIFANPRFEDITRYSFDELASKGRKWLNLLIHPSDIKRSLKNVGEALKGKKFAAIQEYRIIRKDKQERILETLSSVVNYRGKPAMLIVAVDITKRKNAEHKLINSENSLREVNAMKDKFFSIIAHDLKNPFGSIMGFANLLNEGYDNFSEIQRKSFIRSIVESSENTFKLLQNLLEWSRTQTGNIEFSPEKIDLGELVKENIKIFKLVSEDKEIDISSHVTTGLPAFADKNMIKVVIRNLISNAIKFTPRGGEIRISAENTGGMVKLAVQDNGKGIAKKDIKRLFRIDDHFKSTGTEGETGSGLGLILSKEFVEKNGGNIYVESESGKGSTFTFTLPKA